MDVCNSSVGIFVLLEYSCPSVYLSFILETQTDGKWINKDWAKIGSGCVCSVGHVGCLCTDSQSVSEDWVTERGSKAGRTLMDVMLMSSKPINKLSLPLPSPLISSCLFYTLTGRIRWIQLCCQNLQNGLGCSGWRLLKHNLNQWQLSIDVPLFNFCAALQVNIRALVLIIFLIRQQWCHRSKTFQWMRKTKSATSFFLSFSPFFFLKPFNVGKSFFIRY